MRGLDITEKELKVYETLLKVGASTVSGLSRKTGIDQRSVYDYLERLLSKGIVGQIKRNNKRLFLGLNPVMFDMYIDEEMSQVDSAFKELEAFCRQGKELILNYIGSNVEFFRLLRGFSGICEIFIGPGCEEITRNPNFAFFKNNNKTKRINVKSRAKSIALFHNDYFLLFSAAEHTGFFVKDKSFSDNMRVYFR
jgi:hypothetical protein